MGRTYLSKDRRLIDKEARTTKSKKSKPTRKVTKLSLRKKKPVVTKSWNNWISCSKKEEDDEEKENERPRKKSVLLSFTVSSSSSDSPSSPPSPMTKPKKSIFDSDNSVNSPSSFFLYQKKESAFDKLFEKRKPDVGGVSAISAVSIVSPISSSNYSSVFTDHHSKDSNESRNENLLFKSLLSDKEDQDLLDSFFSEMKPKKKKGRPRKEQRAKLLQSEGPKKPSSFDNQIKIMSEGIKAMGFKEEDSFKDIFETSYSESKDPKKERDNLLLSSLHLVTSTPNRESLAKCFKIPNPPHNSEEVFDDELSASATKPSASGSLNLQEEVSYQLQPGQTICLCRNQWGNDTVVGCASCPQLYHPTCVGLTTDVVLERLEKGEFDKWICPCCLEGGTSPVKEEHQDNGIHIPDKSSNEPSEFDDDGDEASLQNQQKNQSIIFRTLKAKTPVVKLQPLSDSLLQKYVNIRESEVRVSMIHDESGDEVMCICREKQGNGKVIGCDYCPEWFHPDCVSLTEEKLKEIEDAGDPWFCPICKKKRDNEVEISLIQSSPMKIKGGKLWRRSIQQQPHNRKTTITTRPSMAVILEENKAEEEQYTSYSRASSTIVPKDEDLYVSIITISDTDQILAQCHQKEILNFSELYPEEILKRSKKIGEGSFGEVFLLDFLKTDPSVLKVLPVNGEKVINEGSQTTLVEVLAEIQVSLNLSQLGERNLTKNFVEVRKCNLTRGNYPKLLLDLWDEYSKEKESLNDRPDFLGEDQLFVTFEFGNGGSDLESAVLNNAIQGISLFNQVAHALAVAETELEFEHRDLHWGNILVKHTDDESLEYVIDKTSNTTFQVKTSGVKATIIDFSLSRLTCYCGGKDFEIFKDLSQDPTLFTAEGDYQFEIYRLMRKHNNDDWRFFNPYTNVLWLHYLLDKLISEVKYKTKKTRLHRSGMAVLRNFKNKILNYQSAKHFVFEEGTPIV